MLPASALHELIRDNCLEDVAKELARYGNITGDNRITCQGTATRLTTYAHLGYRWTVCKVNGTVERIDKRVS